MCCASVRWEIARAAQMACWHLHQALTLSVLLALASLPHDTTSWVCFHIAVYNWQCLAFATLIICLWRGLLASSEMVEVTRCMEQIGGQWVWNRWVYKSSFASLNKCVLSFIKLYSFIKQVIHMTKYYCATYLYWSYMLQKRLFLLDMRKLQNRQEIIKW